MIKKFIKLSDSDYRKYNYIFHKKERQVILNEAMYFRKIYNEMPIETLLSCSINKYLKIKLHKRIFLDIRNDVNAYKAFLDLEFGHLKD